MKLERTKISLEIYGEKYPVRRPSVKEVEALERDIKKKSKSDGELILMKKFLVNVGLPMRVLDDLEANHLLQVAEFLTGVKKN
jgi:hypothetical protein